MSEIYSSIEKPLPPRKKKGRTKRVINTAEYKKFTKKILDGQVGVGEALFATLTEEHDAERFGSKEPARALSLALKDFLKKNNLRAEYVVKQYEPAGGKEGESVVLVEYTVPGNL